MGCVCVCTYRSRFFFLQITILNHLPPFRICINWLGFLIPLENQNGNNKKRDGTCIGVAGTRASLCRMTGRVFFSVSRYFDEVESRQGGGRRFKGGCYRLTAMAPYK